MKRILIVYKLLEGQKIDHELDDKDFAIELVEAETFDEEDDLDVESRLFFNVDWSQFMSLGFFFERAKIAIKQ